MVEQSGDPLAKIVRERQYRDWRHLRIDPASSVKVMRALDGLAKEIADPIHTQGPQHEVTFAQPFALGRCPVTFEEYDHFCAESGREMPRAEGWGRGRHRASGGGGGGSSFARDVPKSPTCSVAPTPRPGNPNGGEGFVQITFDLGACE